MTGLGFLEACVLMRDLQKYAAIIISESAKSDGLSFMARGVINK